MAIATTLNKIFIKHHISNRIFNHPSLTDSDQVAAWHHIQKNKMLTSTVIEAKNHKILVIYPLSRQLNLDLIKIKLGKDYRYLDNIQINKIFKDCDPDTRIPFGYPYGLTTLIDVSVELLREVFFIGGSHTSLVEISVYDFLFLNSGAIKIDCTTYFKKQTVPHKTQNTQDFYNIADFKLPDLPPVARKILALANNSKFDFTNMIEHIAADTDMLAVLPEVCNLEERTLSNYNISQLALCVSTSKAFSLNAEELEDLKQFWLHAFLAGILAEKITEMVLKNKDISMIGELKLDLDPCISYLLGVFHNMGFILFRKLFPPEFKLLQKWRKANPNTPVQDLENKLLGMGRAFHVLRGGHASLSEMLLRSWGMPEIILVVARNHHNLDYSANHHVYVKILQVTNHLLKLHHIGDGDIVPPTENILEFLGLNYDKLTLLLENVLKDYGEVEQIISSITN